MLLPLLVNLGAPPESSGPGPSAALISATVDVFDLATEEPGTRIVHRRAAISPGRKTVRQAREIDARKILEFVVSIRRARGVELWRLRKLWEITTQGVLPLLYPESVHGLGLGDLVVVLADPDISRDYRSGVGGNLQVRLREWRG